MGAQVLPDERALARLLAAQYQPQPRESCRAKMLEAFTDPALPAHLQAAFGVGQYLWFG